MPTKPTRSQFTILKQIVQLIPPHLVAKLARKHDVSSRKYTPWSHVVSMLYAQLTHAFGLNDVCDALRNHRSELSKSRGASPPSRNGLSHANKTRPSSMAEDLFWSVLKQLKSVSPAFGGRTYRGFPRRFKRVIHVVDSTTITLVANCMNWAKHRRRKAAAKTHLRLDLQSFLPGYAVVDTAKENDSMRARECCAGLKSDEIVVFDKAYVDFEHLNDLDERGVFWVTRAKDNMKVRCTKRLIRRRQGNILRDDLVKLKGPLSGRKYAKEFRRVTAIVEVDGEFIEMTFITNNLSWAASSICDLYKCRWAIEAFFKQIKQVLQVCDFLGHNKNAIQWQIWTALLTYVLLRFLAFMSQWEHSFTRIFTTLRAVLWSRFDLLDLLRSYGTAGGSYRMLGAPQQAYLPGFSPN